MADIPLGLWTTLMSLQVRRDEQALPGLGHLRRCARRYAWVPVTYAPFSDRLMRKSIPPRQERVVRIIVIGPPGAGKGTQANKLAAKIAVPHVSTGQLLRESVSMGTKLGVAAKHYVEAGDLVPAGVTNALVADRLSQPDCRSRGFILDGYPRSPDQTEALTRTLTANDASIDAVLNFQVCKGELLKRLRQRARADDTDDVVEHRLQVYREQSAPLLDHYRNELITVDGIGSINDVFARALRALSL